MLYCLKSLYFCVFFISHFFVNVDLSCQRLKFAMHFMSLFKLHTSKYFVSYKICEQIFSCKQQWPYSMEHGSNRL